MEGASLDPNTAPIIDAGPRAELKEMLKAALARADELELSNVAIRISEALDFIDQS